MKIAFTGKGGVGKTTLASTLARLYADEGRPVLAADVDPDANLGLALGLTEEEVNAIVPVSKMKELAKERTAANASNTFYKLNPQVSDLPDKLSKDINGVKLLVMGTVDTGGSGCVCPEHVMLKAILSSLVFRKDDVVIMDMEAGLEHLGRGTASMMDQFIVVIEPGARSVQTYGRIKELAKDIGVTKVRVVANKVRDASDEEFVRTHIPPEDLLGMIHYRPQGPLSLRSQPQGRGGNPRHQGCDRFARISETSKGMNIEWHYLNAYSAALTRCSPRPRPTSTSLSPSWAPTLPSPCPAPLIT